MAALRTDREFQSERELQASICLIFVFPLLVFYWIFVPGGLSKWQQANEAYLKAAFSEADWYTSTCFPLDQVGVLADRSCLFRSLDRAHIEYVKHMLRAGHNSDTTSALWRLNELALALEH